MLTPRSTRGFMLHTFPSVLTLTITPPNKLSLQQLGWDTSSFACHVLMHRPRKPRVSDATQEIHAKIVAKPSGSRASLPKKPAATNTTKMSSTLDHMPVPHLKPLRSHSLRPSPVRPTTI